MSFLWSKPFRVFLSHSPCVVYTVCPLTLTSYSILPFAHFHSRHTGPLAVLEHTKHSPPSELCNVLYPLPGMIVLQIALSLICLLLSRLSLKVIFPDNLSETFLEHSKITIPPCFIFLSLPFISWYIPYHFLIYFVFFSPAASRM